MKKTYKVIGRTKALGHKPNEVFTADLSPKKEQRLIARKAIEEVTDTPVNSEETEQSKEPEKPSPGESEKSSSERGNDPQGPGKPRAGILSGGKGKE